MEIRIQRAYCFDSTLYLHFGKDRIVNVFADREFIGEKWFTWLIENDINFCIRVKNFIVTNHLAKNHKISDLFRHLQVGQTECRKRRIWVGRVKLYISALRLEDGELLLVVSPMFNASAIRDYALRWKSKPYLVVSKDVDSILKILV